MRILLTVGIVFFLVACQHWPPSIQGETVQAPLIYQTPSGEQRFAIIGLGSVLSDKPLNQRNSSVPMAGLPRRWAQLSSRADGIYAKTATGELLRLVEGGDLGSPTLVATPDPRRFALLYLKDRSGPSTLVLRTVENGQVSGHSVVLPLKKSIDTYEAGDFITRRVR